MSDHRYNIHGTASQSVPNLGESGCVGSKAYGPSGIQVYSSEYVKSYKSADITGVGELRVSCCLLPNGNTGFTGYELFSGEVSGLRGCFIMQVLGKIDVKTDSASAEMIIEEGSGTDDLWAIGGAGSFVVAQNGYCSFELSFSV